MLLPQGEILHAADVLETAMLGAETPAILQSGAAYDNESSIDQLVAHVKYCLNHLCAWC